MAIVVALVITAIVMLAHRSQSRRRAWLVAVALAALLFAVGALDLMSAPHRETPLAAPLFGALLPALGATGAAHATRRLSPWLQWGLVLLAAFVLLLGGLLLGATVVPRYMR